MCGEPIAKTCERGARLASVAPMPRTLLRVSVLATALFSAGSACSKSDRRDQFYGTDVGAGWVPDPSSVLDGGADTSNPADATDAVNATDAMDSSTGDALDSAAAVRAGDAAEVGSEAQVDANEDAAMSDTAR